MAEAADQLREAERRIDWVLAHPAFSDWLKDALRSACRRDPVNVGNDAEMLHHLLGSWSSARVQLLMTRAE